MSTHSKISAVRWLSTDSIKRKSGNDTTIRYLKTPRKESYAGE